MKFIVAVVLLLFNAFFNPEYVRLYGQSGDGSSIPYGNNKAAGHFVFLNGVKLYYEVYGKGDPLILLHGNGGNIQYMKYQ